MLSDIPDVSVDNEEFMVTSLISRYTSSVFRKGLYKYGVRVLWVSKSLYYVCV